jgi:hypothetical protein
LVDNVINCDRQYLPLVKELYVKSLRKKPSAFQVVFNGGGGRQANYCMRKVSRVIAVASVDH